MNSILFLHGAGTSDKDSTKYLQESLGKKGIRSYAFNFSGHGGIGLSRSSLVIRYAEAKEAIRDFRLTEPLNICGSSMGGYIAIKLTGEFRVRRLILFAPAVYTPDAFRFRFTGLFSEFIRRKDSWRKSDAFPLLRNFRGELLLFIGDRDDVIPADVPDLIRQNAVLARRVEIVRIPGAPHKLHSWIAGDENLLRAVTGKIVRFMHT